jgi:outer membrane protein
MHYPINSRSSLFAAAIAFLFAVPATSAQAQSADTAQPQDQGNDKDHIIIGAGASYAPAYQGADKYIVMPVPAIDVAWGRFYANLRNGIGVNAIDTSVLTIGGGVSVMPGYRAKDAPAGIGKLSFGVGGRIYANVRKGGFIATIGATKGFSGGTKGLLADASLSYPVAISSRLTLIPTIGTTWADKKHNDRYFGVSARQSLASGLPEFHTGSGFKDASAMLTANYRLTNRISLGASGGVTTLLGNMKDSPLVYHKTQPVGFLSLSYRFGS